MAPAPHAWGSSSDRGPPRGCGGLSARSPAPQARPTSTCSGPAPSPAPGRRVNGPKDGRRWQSGPCPSSRPYTSSPPPARLPFTFSAPDRPCRSRSEAAMTVTRGRAGRKPDRPEVASGMTPPGRAHHRPRARPLRRGHQSQAGTGAGQSAAESRGLRAHSSCLPAPGPAPQATPARGAANHRRGCLARAISGLAARVRVAVVLRCYCPCRAGATSARVSFQTSGPNPASSVWRPRGTLGPDLRARPASLGRQEAASGRTRSCDAHSQQWSPLFIAHPADHLGRDRGHPLSP